MRTPIDWLEITIGELGQVVTGRTPASAEPELFGDTYPFITPSDMSFGVRSVIPERRLSHAGAERLKRIQLPTGSTCFVCIGATIGKVCLTTAPSFTNQQLNSVVPDTTRNDPRFVYYLLVSVAGEIAALASGAATPIINKSAFSAVRVKVPPLPTQNRIATILSAYDDLIENNTRRIAILEEMARQLYEEWFVRFRFPGHEETEFDGELPRGWRNLPLSAVAEFKRGKQQLTKAAYAQEGYTAYSASGPDGLLETWEADGKAVIVSGVGAYCGKTWLARGKWTCIANTFYLRPTLQHLSAELLYLATFGIGFWPRRGAAQPFISTGDAGAKIVMMASSQVLSAFNQAIVPMLDQVAVLGRKNANLRAQRDMLLPKLISGEIDVSGAEELLEAAE